MSKVPEGNLDQYNVQINFEKNMFEKSKKLTNIKSMKPTDSRNFF
jgi:hypothetical protein